MAKTNRILQATDGTNTGQFGPKDWAMVATVSLLWGSSYLWIAIGLEAFPPAVVAWLRLAFGAAILVVLTIRTRVSIERADWAAIVVVGLVGNAGPALLFALAEQRVESAVVGMITGATPILTLVLAVAVGTRSLRPINVIGLGLGFVGIVMMSIPNLTGEDASLLGITYVLLAVMAYSITSIVLGPLQKKYGGMAVIRAAQVVALLSVTPLAAASLDGIAFTWRAFGAVVFLGIFGTGIARATFANLIGSAGATRAQVVGYLVPVTAVVLGVSVLAEQVSPTEYVGLAVVLIGAFLTTRSSSRPSRSPGARVG